MKIALKLRLSLLNCLAVLTTVTTLAVSAKALAEYEGKPMHVGQSGGDSYHSIDDSAAHIMVLVLRAIASASDSSSHLDTVIADSGVHGLKSVVRHLHRLPKPLQCKGKATNAGLEIQCGPIEHEQRWIYEANLPKTSDISALLGETGRKAVWQSPNPRVLVLGRDGESLLVTLPALQAFYRDYLIVGSYIRSGRLPTETESNTGAVWVILFGPSDGFTNFHIG